MKKIVLISLLFLSSCSENPEIEDPNIEFNRDMMNFNLAVDENILKPVSDVYKEGTSDTFRESVGNFLSNFKEPYYMLNYILAGDPEQAINSLFRFVTNTVFGALGFADIGNYVGLEKRETSYKETLTTLGVDTGNYLVLPIFGPSSTRDAFGEVASWFCDPVSYIIGFPYMFGKAILTTINDRAENSEMLDRNISESMDIYSVAKSLYFQKYGKKSKNDDEEENIMDEEFSDETENSAVTDHSLKENVQK
ncbi:MAG: VacJ family lipoprotein [Alphaproteobacteria bacterium]|nr:VacJ family lipoprotein [Alphaproteobacteria bacterium]